MSEHIEEPWKKFRDASGCGISSIIAVELVNGEPRSYFYSTTPAPKDRIEKKGEDGIVYGVRMLMPNRDEKNFLGVFHGAVGAANFKNMCFRLGITNGDI